jgi:hypothetical protein
MRRRIEDLLGKVESGLPSGEELQALRAVEVLERVGGPEARQALTALSAGAPAAPLTVEAQKALKRIK